METQGYDPQDFDPLLHEISPFQTERDKADISWGDEFTLPHTSPSAGPSQISDPGNLQTQPAGGGSFEAEIATTYIKALDDVDRLKALLLDAKKRADNLEEKLAKTMILNGTQRRTTVDGKTVYLSTDLFVSKRKDVDTKELLGALVNSGLSDFLVETYAAGKLKSWLRELLTEGTGDLQLGNRATSERVASVLPIDLIGLLSITTKVRARVQGRRSRKEAESDEFIDPSYE